MTTDHNGAGDALHVAVGVLCRDREVLLARRPPGVHLAGLWEFPGGKVEPGEDVLMALRRELAEELAIVPSRVEPLIRVSHHYPEGTVILDCWRVLAFEGAVRANEHQSLAWVPVERLQEWPLPPADRGIVAALRLPRHYVITPEPGDDAAFFAQLERLLNRGVALLQLRSKHLPEEAYADLARRVIARAKAFSCRVLLNGRPELAIRLQAAGVHLSHDTAAALSARPVPGSMWCGVSCHTASDLVRAMALDADFAVLSPVKPTRSHPDAAPLGWERFKELVRPVSIPVFALGGMRPEEAAVAVEHGGQGVAGIRGFWPLASNPG